MSVDAKQTLRIFKPAGPTAALGLAVSHLMVKPAFANLKFGDWSRILVGQINRGHYCFAVDGDNQVQGFMGWAFADKDKAEAWVDGRRPLSFEDSRNGDCMVINAWSANSTRVFATALTSSVSAGSAGVTSTVVSAPSPATIRTSATLTSIVAVIGSGVGKTGMAAPSWGARVASPQVGD